MALPKFVNIKEVGPREGMQFEKGPIATADKIRLVDMLSECNFKQIEATSFVSPKWVPQMADADEVTRGFTRRPGTEYSCIFLNAKGLERAVAHGKFDIRGTLWATATDTFSKKNTNKNIEETYVDLDERAIELVEQRAHAVERPRDHVRPARHPVLQGVSRAPWAGWSWEGVLSAQANTALLAVDRMSAAGQGMDEPTAALFIQVREDLSALIDRLETGRLPESAVAREV